MTLADDDDDDDDICGDGYRIGEVQRLQFLCMCLSQDCSKGRGRVPGFTVHGSGFLYRWFRVWCSRFWVYVSLV